MTEGEQIVPAVLPGDAALVRNLFMSYADMIESLFGVPPDVHQIAQDCADLPGAYAAPDGVILLARDQASNEVLGGAALRRFDERSCEVKRLYVYPAARGRNLGRHIMEAAIEQARAMGYARMLLDTGTNMEAAVTLYRSMGFTEVAPFNDNPLEVMIYFSLDLTAND